MKIIVSKNKGIYNALHQAGYDVIDWNPNQKSLFDLFEENKPELFIGDKSQLSWPFIRCVEGYQTPTLLFRQKFTVSALTTDQSLSSPYIKYFGPTEQSDGLLLYPAADVTLLQENLKNYNSDVSYIGNYTDNAKKYIELFSNQNIKSMVFGYTSWPIAQYLGSILDTNICSVYKNSLVCPHLGNVSSRPYQILASDGFCVSINSIPDLPEIPVCYDLIKFVKQIKSKEADRKLAGKAKVLANHTYHHRLYDIFNFLDMPDQAYNIMKGYKGLQL